MIVYICFILATMMLAASPVRAADGSSSERKAIVVRADPRTGKLVRSVIPAPGAPAFKPQPQISEIVDHAAKAHEVDPLLVHSIIKVESNYNSYAVSSKGAEGLMQLSPGTARMLGVTNSFDPEQNIEAGVKYLKYLQGIYKDDQLALAAYNAGPGAVQKYKQIPPYKETQNYVKQVGKNYSNAKAAAEKQTAAKPADPPQPPEHPKLEKFVDENGRLYLKTTQ
jgi:soluble lytic murein transglycosylase-like protein